MLLLFRFVAAMALSLFRPRIGFDGEAVTRLTVLPHDCDLNLHLNAGRYLSFMDVARGELLGRLRLLGPLLRRGWRPVMGGCVIRFRRSLLPFQRFTIRSRVAGWDEKWFYIEHVAERDGALCAVGHVRTLIRSRSGNVSPRDVLALGGVTDPAPPPLPSFVADWREIEEAR